MFVLTGARAHFLTEIDKIWYEASQVLYLSLLFSSLKILTPTCHKRPARPVIWIGFVFTDARAHFLLKIGKIWCNKCNIQLCYFLHTVKILTHSSHKRPAHTVLWIQFIFTDAWVHFLSEIDEISNKKYGSGWYLLTHGRIFCRKLVKFGVKLAKCNIYL